MTQIIKEVKNRQTKEKSLKKLKVAAYCRVSTLNEEQELSYESQLSYYKELIRNKHNMELVGVYGDQGFSGLRADNRPEFQRLIQDCSKGKINLIMVKSISRFSRNSVDCQSYLNRLKDYSVQVFFEREGIYSDNPQCELILKFLSACAQEESNSISQTIKWANEKNNESGKPTRQCCYGYIKESNGHHWLVDTTKKEAIILLFDLFIEGKTLKEIKSELTLFDSTEHWTINKVRYRLQNEAYTGNLLIGKTYSPDLLSKKRYINSGQSIQYLIEDHHEAIIDKKLFDNVQLIFKRRKKK